MTAGTSTGAPKTGGLKNLRKLKKSKSLSKSHAGDSGADDDEEEQDVHERSEDDRDETEARGTDYNHDDMGEHPTSGARKVPVKKPFTKSQFKGETGTNDDENEEEAGGQAGGGASRKEEDKGKAADAQTAPGAIARAEEVKDLRKQLNKVLKYRRLPRLRSTTRGEPEGESEDASGADVNEESFEKSLNVVETQVSEAATVPVAARAEALEAAHKSYQKAIQRAQTRLGSTVGGGFLLSIAGGLALKITKGTLGVIDLGQPESDQEPTEIVATQTRAPPKSPTKVPVKAIKKRAEALKELLGDAMDELGEIDVYDEAVLDTFDQYKALATYSLASTSAPSFK